MSSFVFVYFTCQLLSFLIYLSVFDFEMFICQISIDDFFLNFTLQDRYYHRKLCHAWNELDHMYPYIWLSLINDWN